MFGSARKFHAEILNLLKASGSRSKITQNDQIGEKSLAEKKVVWNDMNALVAQECVKTLMSLTQALNYRL